MENSEVESTTLYSKESMGILSSCSDLCDWHSDLEGRFEFRSHSLETVMKTSVWRLSREHRSPGNIHIQKPGGRRPRQERTPESS